MDKISKDLNIIAKNNDMDLNVLNKNNVYNMKKMLKNVEMFRGQVHANRESIEVNEFDQENVDKYFMTISNTLLKLEKNGNEGLKALSNWNTLLEVFNRLSQACEYLFENVLTAQDLDEIYADIDNLYTLINDILNFLYNLELEETLDDIYTQLSDLYSKYNSVLAILKSIEDILNGIIASPLVLLAASDTVDITVDGTTTLVFDLTFESITAAEQIVPEEVLIDDFALNGLFIAEDEYVITDKYVTSNDSIRITIELNDPVVLEVFEGEIAPQVALLQCLCNTKIISAGAAPCTVLVTIQAVDGETHIDYISNNYYIDLSIILNGSYLSPMIDYTLNRANEEPTGYVESIDFNYPIHGKLVIIEKFIGYVVSTMASSGGDSDSVLVISTNNPEWNDTNLTTTLNDIDSSIKILESNPGMTDQEVLDAIKNVDGINSGLDADLLDGLDSTAFLKTYGGTITGPLTTNALTVKGTGIGDANSNAYMDFQDANGTVIGWFGDGSAGNSNLTMYAALGDIELNSTTGNVKANNQTVYHSGNLLDATTTTSGLFSASDKTKLDGIVPGGVSGGTGDTDWTVATKGNGWIDFGGATQPVGFRKTGEGLVIMRGAMKSGSLNGSVFTLPEGYRPASESFMAVATNTTGGFIGGIKITTAGVVSVTAGSTAAVFLDGVTFYADL